MCDGYIRIMFALEKLIHCLEYHKRGLFGVEFAPFKDFESACLLNGDDLDSLYARGIFTINGKDYNPMMVYIQGTFKLCADYKLYLNQLKKMGRRWHDEQEFNDFKLLCELKAAGETVLIGIEE